MKTLMLDEVRRAVRGRWKTRGDVLTVSSVNIDSRQKCPGSLFVPIRGERFDGHDFLADAAAGGAVAALIAQDANVSGQALAGFAGGTISVQDTTVALGDLAAFHRRAADATAVIAVTGSCGKTTVKRMIDHILSTRLHGRASPKSFNNSIGVPLTLLDVGAGDDYVVCEIGSNAAGEIDSLARIARPDVGVITFVGPAHLGRFGSIEKIALEKASLLASVEPDGIAVVWADSDLLDRACITNFSGRLVRFGLKESAELRLTKYAPTDRGCRFELNGRLSIDLPLPGRHNAINALAAIAVAQRFGFTAEQAASALASLQAAHMRLERFDVGEGAIINDAYNANPASVRAAAEVLAEMPARRRVLVLGDMLELGDAAESIHRQLGRDLAFVGPGRRGPDLLIGVGELASAAAGGFAQSGGQAEAFKTVADAAAAMDSLIAPGDTVLIKGSRGMAMEQLVEPARAALLAGQADRAEA